MKKILFLLLMPLFSFGQTFTVIDALTTPTSDTTMATIPLPDNEAYQYDVGITFEWYGVGGTLDGKVILKHSIVDSLKIEYDAATYIDIDAAASYGYIEVFNVTADNLYLYLDVNNLSGGTFNAWAAVKQKR